MDSCFTQIHYQKSVNFQEPSKRTTPFTDTHISMLTCTADTNACTLADTHIFSHNYKHKPHSPFSHKLALFHIQHINRHSYIHRTMHTPTNSQVLLTCIKSHSLCQCVYVYSNHMLICGIIVVSPYLFYKSKLYNPSNGPTTHMDDIGMHKM